MPEASRITQDSAASSARLRMAMSGQSPAGRSRMVAGVLLGSPLPRSSPVTEMAAARGAIVATTWRHVITYFGAMKNPVPRVLPAWIWTVHLRSSSASRCRWPSSRPPLGVISPSLVRPWPWPVLVPLEVHRNVGRRAAPHQHGHQGALFQLEFKSELDTEMVRFDRLDRAGDVTA